MKKFFSRQKTLQKTLLFILIWAAMLLPSAGLAQDAEQFIVEDIRIEGLQRFSPGAVFSKIPVGIGDQMSPQQTIDIIEALYATGFFRSVDVLREGGVLIIRVDENPTIAEVTINGSKALSDKALTSLLESAGIAKAKVFNQSVVDQAARVIENAYVERNYYEAKVAPVISPLPRNRVAVLFNIDEGDAAGIRSISFFGNQAFSDWRLRRTMHLETRGLLSFLGDSHLYTEQKLDADLARIRTLYLEDGYLNFKIESKIVEVSSDKKSVDILIYVSEGERYIVSEVELAMADADAESFPFALETYRQFVTQRPGELYSGRLSSEAVEAIKQKLGEQGYASARVEFNPQLNDDTGEVKVVYDIFPGAVSYVRRIDINGNEFTSDKVIRRELLQFESERYDADKVERSRRRVRRLGYFNNVNVETAPVQGSDGEVDLLFDVEEANTGEIRLGAGFQTDGGLSFNAGFSNNNVFGTGNDFAANFTRSEDDVRVDFELKERYHTQEGVSRRVAASYGEEESSSDSSNYSIQGFKGEYGYEWPFADDGQYEMFMTYERVKINNPSALNSVYTLFVEKHGADFDSLLFSGGLNYDIRDSANLPTDGQHIRVNGEVSPPILELRYYYLTYLHDWYRDLEELPTEPVLHLKLGGGYGDSYGDGVYPFYRRFFLGGVDSLRGFSPNSIGYESDTAGDALGGKSRLYGSAELSAEADFFIFEEQQVFLVPFLDFGMVGEEAGLGSMRASWGVEFRWRSPIGPLRFSYVDAFRSKPGDDVETFQFSVKTF